MISGIGTDIVEISRIERLMENPSFLKKCFTAREIEYIKDKPHSAAGHFAAKEAYSKALGTGFRGFSLTDIEILHDDLNKPYIRSYNKAKTDYITHLSISHSDNYAIAYVVIDK